MTSKKREYRTMKIEPIKRDGDEPSFLVRGYASTFSPYVLFSCDGIDYKEQIDPHAFAGCDMSDVVFRVDHMGPVYARTSNNKLKVWVDDHGLANEANLDSTAKARSLYEDIAAGMYPQMSFAFTVAQDHYVEKERLRVIDKIEKLYDVSPVTFPANSETEISARDYFNGVIEAEKAERLERERRARRDALRRKLLIEKIKEGRR